MNLATFDHIVGQWSRAAIEPSRWAQALSSVADALGAPSAVLFTPEPDAGRRSMAVAHGTATAAFGEYASHWIEEDPWFAQMRARQIVHPAGNVSYGRELVEPRQLRRTGFYNDFAARHGIHDAMSLVLCDRSDTAAPVTRLTLHRPHRQVELGRSHDEALCALWPHLQRAVRAHWMLRHVHDAARLAEHALEAVPHPTWVLTEDAGIAFANGAARDAMRGQSWLRCSRGRLLGAGQVDVQMLLREHRGRDTVAPARLAVACVAEGRLLRATLHVNRIADAPRFASVWPQGHVLLLLDLHRPESPPGWLALFAAHHGLTRAESRVLEGLVQGRDLPAVAATLGIGYSTARTHMRVLLEKTGSARQADLVRRALGA